MNIMLYTVQTMNSKQKEDTATLEILQAIENKKDVTQRHLADRLDVALGLTNSYLKRCVNKGLIKIHQAPANRYFYYLTPKGFTEKSRLTAQYLSSSFDFYRKAANSVCELFVECRNKGLQKIAFYGVSELAEIASLKTHDFGLEHIMTFDDESKLEMFLGKPVYKYLSESRDVDAYLITSLSDSKQILERLEKAVDDERILVPSILGLNRQ
jgi:DNA-binding MarR family transcriptional regulator